MAPSSGDRAPSLLGCQIMQLLIWLSWGAKEVVVERVRWDASRSISELDVLQRENQEIPW